MQLVPFESTCRSTRSTLYFKERAGPAGDRPRGLDALRARGLPFHERYVKSARIELDPGPIAATPVGMGLDVCSGAAAPPPATEAAFQLLRDGQPLANFDVELVNERSPLGLWHRTDAAGRMRIEAAAARPLAAARHRPAPAAPDPPPSLLPTPGQAAP